MSDDCLSKFERTIFAQSICTNYSSLSGRPDIFLGSGTGKKSGPKKSRVQKKRVIVIQKEKKPDCLFSFWITTTRFFSTRLFLDLIFFQGHKPTHVFKTRIVGADWLGEWVKLNKICKKNIQNVKAFCSAWVNGL